MSRSNSICSPRMIPPLLNQNDDWRNIDFFLGQGAVAESRQNFGEAKDYYLKSTAMMLELVKQFTSQQDVESFLKRIANDTLDKAEYVKQLQKNMALNSPNSHQTLSLPLVSPSSGNEIAQQGPFSPSSFVAKTGLSPPPPQQQQQQSNTFSFPDIPTHSIQSPTAQSSTTSTNISVANPGNTVKTPPPITTSSVSPRLSISEQTKLTTLNPPKRRGTAAGELDNTWTSIPRDSKNDENRRQIQDLTSERNPSIYQASNLPNPVPISINNAQTENLQTGTLQTGEEFPVKDKIGSGRPSSDYDFINSLRNDVKQNLPSSSKTVRKKSSDNSNRRLSSTKGRHGRKDSSSSPYKSPYSQDRKNKKEETSDSENPLEDTIRQQMMDKAPNMTWNDVAGLDDVKQILKESVVLPNLRPDLFTGLRSPSKGCLMFGPPGTGKTLLAKVVAAESGYSFFSISASSLMSKWIGEGEKMVKALFAVARKEQPSVIFIDEIDSMLSARRDGEHEASRRMKTEFLVQLDGADVDLEEDKILIMAATNLPWGLDEAVLRRMTKKVYIPLPDANTRKHLIYRLLAKGNVKIDKSLVVDKIVTATEEYSCSDINLLCKEAAMGPLRSYGDKIAELDPDDIRGITIHDFQTALKKVRPTVTQETLQRFTDWFKENGYEN